MHKIMVTGNLGQEPTERRTKTGKGVISFSLAAHPKAGTVVWYDVSIWEDKWPVFEKMLSYLKRGSRVTVIGDLFPEIYEGKMGPKLKMRVNPDSISFAGGGEKKEEPSVFDEQATRGKAKPQESSYEEELPF